MQHLPEGINLYEYRVRSMTRAKTAGVKTWVSFEPVLDADTVLNMIWAVWGLADRVKIGKLNYHPSDIDWAAFGLEAERICKVLGYDYYIKDSLRAEMEAANGKSQA